MAVDVANMTTGQAATLLNSEVTKMHQDPLGAVGKRVEIDQSCVQHSPIQKPAPGATNPVGVYPPCQIWAKTLSPVSDGPARAIALYNSDDAEHVIHLDLWTVFGDDAPRLGESTKVHLRDLWAKTDLGAGKVSLFLTRFQSENRSFPKTGSGQTQGNRTQRGVFAGEIGISTQHNATVPASGVVLLRATVIS